MNGKDSGGLTSKFGRHDNATTIRLLTVVIQGGSKLGRSLSGIPYSPLHREPITTHPWK